MKKIEERLKGFIDTEFIFMYSVWCERDPGLYQKIAKKHQSYFSKGANPLIGRPIPLPDKWFENCENERQYLKKREIFKIKTFDNAKEGIIHLSYLGSTYNYLDGKYDICLVWEEIEELKELRIVSQYYEEPLREDFSSIFFRSGQIKWFWGAGKQIASLGILTSVRNYKKPNFPIHLYDYLSE